MTSPGPTIPADVQRFDHFGRYDALRGLAGHGLPVPTPTDVYIELQTLDHEIQLSSCHPEVKFSSKKLVHDVLSRNSQSNHMYYDLSASA
jgi:hypothetical protein